MYIKQNNKQDISIYRLEYLTYYHKIIESDVFNVFSWSKFSVQ